MKIDDMNAPAPPLWCDGPDIVSHPGLTGNVKLLSHPLGRLCIDKVHESIGHGHKAFRTDGSEKPLGPLAVNTLPHLLHQIPACPNLCVFTV